MTVTYYDCAQIAAAVYDFELSEVGGFSRHHPLKKWNGFQGAIFKTGGDKKAVVVAFTGTNEKKLVDSVANAGFGQKPLATTGYITLAAVGALALASQARSARSLYDIAVSELQPGDSIYLSGHSLGGGLALMVAAATGCPCVTFNAPSVSGVARIVAKAKKSKGKIIRVQAAGDPINVTLQMDKMYGSVGEVFTLMGTRSGGDAHCIAKMRDDLGPSGGFTIFGERTLAA